MDRFFSTPSNEFPGITKNYASALPVLNSNNTNDSWKNSLLQGHYFLQIETISRPLSESL